MSRVDSLIGRAAPTLWPAARKMLGPLRYHAAVTLVGGVRCVPTGSGQSGACAPSDRAGPRILARCYARARGSKSSSRGIISRVGTRTSGQGSLGDLGRRVEPLVALGSTCSIPRTTGPMCGIRRTAEELCGFAEQAGYCRDLCSYARTDLGRCFLARARFGPLRGPTCSCAAQTLPNGALLVPRATRSTSACPLAIVDTPFPLWRAPGARSAVRCAADLSP